MPLVFALFLLFAWSMDGDIFRGLLSLPPVAEPGIAPFQTRLWLFITVILLLVFSITLTMARAIMPVREGWDGDDQKRWKGAIKEGDLWEREFGVIVARLATRRFAMAVRASVRPLSFSSEEKQLEERRLLEDEESNQVSDLSPTTSTARSRRARALAIPINALVLPLDIALVGLRLVQRTSATHDLSKTDAYLLSLRDWMALLIMGPPCFLLALVDGPYNGDFGKA